MVQHHRLKVGIAGFGIVGKRRREYIDKHPRLHTVAVCDKTFNNAGQFDDGLSYYPGFEQMLAQEELDILFVCLSNDVAPTVTIAGLEKGLHVFCEKPPGRDLDDIARVCKTAERFPELKLKYGFNHRYHDSVIDALNIVQSGELGDIIHLRGVYGKSKVIDLGANNQWRAIRACAGGGILLDQGIHMVDLLRLFGGDYTDVHSFISNNYWHHDVEDNAYAIMRTGQGVVAMLHSSSTQWRHCFSLEIGLQKGMITLSGILSSTKSYGAETMTVAWKSENDGGDPREQSTRYNEDHSWQDEIDEFAQAILTDKRIINGSCEEALKTMQLVYDIYCADTAWKEKFDLSNTVSKELS